MPSGSKGGTGLTPGSQLWAHWFSTASFVTTEMGAGKTWINKSMKQNTRGKRSKHQAGVRAEERRAKSARCLKIEGSAFPLVVCLGSRAVDTWSSSPRTVVTDFQMKSHAWEFNFQVCRGISLKCFLRWLMLPQAGFSLMSWMCLWCHSVRQSGFSGGHLLKPSLAVNEGFLERFRLEGKRH